MSNTYLQLTISNNIGLGINIFKTTNITGIVNVGIGGNILMNNTAGKYNTAIGSNVYASNVSGSYNTGVGTNSGNSNLGSNNTMLGANTGQTFNDTNVYNNSTAIGYGATINTSNQIVFGTTTEYVKIPSAVASNNGTVGALVVGSGGMSVAGNIFVSGTIYINGTMVSTTTNGSLNTNFGTNPLTTGNMGATTLQLSGSLTAGNISVGTINSISLNCGINTLTAGNIYVGTVVGGATTVSTISCGTNTTGTMFVSTLSCGNLSVDTINTIPFTLKINQLTAGSVSVGTIVGGNATLTSISVGTISTGLITTGTLSVGNIIVGTVTSGNINMNTNLLTAGNLSVGIITGGAVIATTVSTGSMTVGSIVPTNLFIGNLTTGNIVSGSHNMATNPLTCGNMNVNGITSGGLTTFLLSSGIITAGNVSTSVFITSNISTGAVAYNVGLNAGGNPLTAGNLTVGTIISSSINMTTNPLTAGNISAGAIITGPIYTGPGPYSLIAGGASVGNITTTNYYGNQLTCGGISSGIINASFIGVGKTNPNASIDVNGTINATNYYLNGTVLSAVNNNIYLDGSTSVKAAPSAKFIQDNFFQYTDGVYWINLPTVGPTQIYCIMNPAYAGGGWMLAMKGGSGSNLFAYTTSYWTSTNTLNTGDNVRSDADAKFQTFNYFPATDWMAIFPTRANGGDIPTSLVNTGWTWVENNAVNMTIPLVSWFALGIQNTKLCNGISTIAGYPFIITNPIPLNSTKYYSNNITTTFNQPAASPAWTVEYGFQWYGFNYTSGASTNFNMRWGLNFNNELDQNSNDNRGGIGLSDRSAGDTGIGTFRFEWYVR